MKTSSAIVAAALQLAPSVLGADTAAWKTRNIYFALTDRIARGSDDTGGDGCSDLGDYCGGTFQGLESQLDYIQDMGFDAIWITPVVQNVPGAYHGYGASDLYAINSNYGTEDDLKSLVGAAHERGMFIMADVVANHMGSGDVSNYRPEPLNQESSYHEDCIMDWDSQESMEICRLMGLPDLKTTDPEIRTLLNDWIKWLVEEYSFDGLRIDTVRHVEQDFWPDFCTSAGVYTIGEVWDGNPDYLAGYADLMSGLLDYAIYYPMNRFYQQSGSSQDLVEMHDRITNQFSDPSAWGTFLDNHDNARWLNQKDDTSLLQNALAYVILSRGIPIVYYGTEQGYKGGDDPANREDLWRTGFNREADLYQAIKRLSSAKKAHGGLGDDDHVHLHSADSGYAWSRADGDLIVLTTNYGSGHDGEYCFDTGRADGSWEDVFGSGAYSADGDGRVCVEISNGLPVVLSSSA